MIFILYVSYNLQKRLCLRCNIEMPTRKDIASSVSSTSDRIRPTNNLAKEGRKEGRERERKREIR